LTDPLFEFMKKSNKLILIIIFVFIFAIRIIGLNWDNGHHLHPDERFLTMVIEKIQFPSTLSMYFNTSLSPLNPHNQGFDFFVYGTFPVFLNKVIGHFLNLNTYETIHILGRILSILMDLGISFFLFKLVFLLSKNFNKACISALLYGVMILPIQLSHFFTVDTFLNFFIFLTFFCLVYFIKTKKEYFFYLSCLSFGLAFSSKISAIYFLPFIFYFLFLYKKNFLKNIFLFLILFFLTIRIFQPYFFVNLFQINLSYLSNFQVLKSLDYNLYYPPALQWFGKTKIIYPLYNLFFWGLGLPLSCLFIFSLSKLFTKKNLFLTISLFWILFLILVQGVQFVQTMRYFLPIYPFIALIIGFYFDFKKPAWKFFLFLHLIYLLFFLSIFLRPHPRQQASIWLYENTQKNESIASEYWDDPLPLISSQSPYRKQLILDTVAPESQEKWLTINSQLQQSDYLVLSSNRIWLPILNNRQAFKKTASFYSNLFSGNSSFKLIKEFNSYPGISLPFLTKCLYLGPSNQPSSKNKFVDYLNCDHPGIYLRDDLAEEAFSVYDHPKVLIFQKQ